MRVAVDRTVCVATGQCAATVPEFFAVDDDGVVRLRQDRPPAMLRQRVQEAAGLCPVAAIAVRDEAGGSEGGAP
ncbi:ferredoxin [Streptomyces sp. NPDC088350]|uniref:ferredoxin n=1 Tax=Streptomyces sp. NPDC088350 TaxID=3365854 RepID=UPI0037FCD9C0